MIDLLWPALVAGSLISLLAGPLGSFLVWRKMAYFGETMAHSGLLGITLAVLLNWNITVGIALITSMLALLLFALQHQHRIPADTLLGIMSHGSLALGMLVLAFSTQIRTDLTGLLFGDLLSVGSSDLWLVAIIITIGLPLLITIWKPLLAITVNEDLAKAEGINTSLIKVVFLLLVALTIATAMKIVGVLLITALMIIPPAAARFIAKTPEQMGVIATIIAVLSVWLGISGSWQFDAPTGPAIVAMAVVFFVASVAVTNLKQKVN
ncbi:iron chelate uptake ABC transporter family permease subunit [Reinekea marina]|uniref:High-affinity zinc uptake system membrane protein ZnuB n=1 Tax=Reinekea marina TaxID=1310421 RepID=A0ABV7WX84_9GAMM|nr:iron chelate uptake ABC transporter family permease subunit [Reinekea marina]MDN3649826.1 iron chelate uptake ABC transporter family permease subunit [Reinekea marina]